MHVCYIYAPNFRVMFFPENIVPASSRLAFRGKWRKGEMAHFKPCTLW